MKYQPATWVQTSGIGNVTLLTTDTQDPCEITDRMTQNTKRDGVENAVQQQIMLLVG